MPIQTFADVERKFKAEAEATKRINQELRLLRERTNSITGGAASAVGTTSGSGLSNHELVGAFHTATGLTTGYVVRATGSTTFAFQQLSHSDLGSVSADDHHDPVTVPDTSLTLSTQALSVNLRSSSGLLISSGLGIELQSNPGLSISGSGLIIDLDTDPGLVLGAGGIKILLDTNPGLALSVTGLTVDLDSNSGLQTGAGGISIDLQSPSGLELGASGLAVDDTVAGAGLAIAAKVLSVGSGDGLTVGANDIALTTPGTLNISTTNDSSGNHTHVVTTTADGFYDPSTILNSDASGNLAINEIWINGIIRDYTLSGNAIDLHWDSWISDSIFLSSKAGISVAFDNNNDLSGHFRIGKGDEKIGDPNYIELFAVHQSGHVSVYLGNLQLRGSGPGQELEFFNDGVIVTNVGGLDINPTTDLTVNAGTGIYLNPTNDTDVMTGNLIFSDSGQKVNFTNAGLIDTDSGDLTLQPAGNIIIDPDSFGMLPALGYEINIGALNKKYLTLHVAELWASNLVVQNTIATIGGHILVGPTTVLTEDLNDSDTQIFVRHNQMTHGDIAYMESYDTGTLKVEFFEINSYDLYDADTGFDRFKLDASVGDVSSEFPGGTKFTIDGTGNSNDTEWTVDSSSWTGTQTQIYVTGDVTDSDVTPGHVLYRGAQSGTEFEYVNVERNKESSVDNSWYAGDAMFNTGSVGDGFIDLYSLQGVESGSTAGPTIVGNVRYGSTYNYWSEHWAIGHLNGVYGQSASTYGTAFGRYAAGYNHILITDGGGIEFYDGLTTKTAQLTGTTWTLGQVTAAQNNIRITSGQMEFRNDETVKVLIQADGDLFVGTDTSAPATTGLAIFTTNPSPDYNGDATIDAGDILIGDNTAGKANVLWDKSAGQLLFRGGTTSQAWIDTDGAITAGGGDVILNEDGVTILVDDAYEISDSLLFYDSANAATVGEFFTVGNRGGVPILPNVMNWKMYSPVGASTTMTFDSDGALSVPGLAALDSLEVTNTSTFNDDVTISSGNNLIINGPTGYILLDDSTRAITWNDGEGNFNIRSNSIGTAVHSIQGGLGAIVFSTDGAVAGTDDGVIALQTGPTRTAGSAAAYTSALAIFDTAHNDAGLWLGTGSGTGPYDTSGDFSGGGKIAGFDFTLYTNTVYHQGDLDTYLQFGTNMFTLRAKFGSAEDTSIIGTTATGNPVIQLTTGGRFLLLTELTSSIYSTYDYFDIPNSIRHAGDVNTNIGFPVNDTVTINGGGTTLAQFIATGQKNVKLGDNAGVLDIDIYLHDGLFVQGTNGYVGIKDTTPSYPLDVTGQARITRGASGASPHSYSELIVEDDNHSAISILTPNNKTGYLMFADPQDDFVGGMYYVHSDDRLTLTAGNAAILDFHATYIGDEWTVIAPAPGWTHYDSSETTYRKLRYKKVGDLVFLDGLVKRNTALFNSLIGVVPYGPYKQQLFAQRCHSGFNAAGTVRIDIEADGDIVLNAYAPDLEGNNGDWIALSGIVFSTSGT